MVRRAAAEFCLDGVLSLESLTIKRCVNLSDTGLNAFVTKHCTQLKSFTVSHCRFTDSAINAVLHTTYRTLQSLRCERCPESCPLESVLRTMSEIYTTSDSKYQSPALCVLKTFSLSHTSFSTLNISSINIGAWLPLITRLETGLDGVAYLRVYEEEGDKDGLGGVMRDSEFVVAVTYRQGDRPQERRVVQLAENRRGRSKARVERQT
eukprot:gene31278-38645_t